MGTIEYQYSYESSTLNVDSLTKYKPYKSEFRFDTINYQSRFFGIDTMTYYYSGQLKKCISQTNSDKNVACEDYSIATDSIIFFKITETSNEIMGHPFRIIERQGKYFYIYEKTERIMGHHCRIIEWQGKYFYNIYYVSTDLKIAPYTYKDHLAYNWKFYGEKTGGGLILKSEHRFKNFTMRSNVVNIKEEGNDFKSFMIGNDQFDIYCK